MIQGCRIEGFRSLLYMFSRKKTAERAYHTRGFCKRFMVGMVTATSEGHVLVFACLSLCSFKVHKCQIFMS
jgi:hypothetical protein